MICTSIEQSKHLLELGLDPKTADMWWSNRFVYWQPTPMIGISTEQHQLYTFKWCEMDVPAWSLTALLEVMPKVIVHDMNKHVLCLRYAEGIAPFMYYVVESGRNKGKLIRFNNGRCAPDAYDALDAAYQMVCWLLEQGLIKKGDNDANTSKS